MTDKQAHLEMEHSYTKAHPGYTYCQIVSISNINVLIIMC